MKIVMCGWQYALEECILLPQESHVHMRPDLSIKFAWLLRHELPHEDGGGVPCEVYMKEIFENYATERNISFPITNRLDADTVTWNR